MSEASPSAVSRPSRMRRAKATRYLLEKHGIELEDKTLANRNASGLGPFPEYLGTIPYYRTEVLDAWAETAFTPESPVAVTRRKAAAAAQRPTGQPNQPRRAQPMSNRRNTAAKT